MKTKEQIKTEVEDIIRNVGYVTRHLWEVYDANIPSSANLYMLNLIGEAQKPLAELLKSLENQP